MHAAINLSLHVHCPARGYRPRHCSLPVVSSGPLTTTQMAVRQPRAAEGACQGLGWEKRGRTQRQTPGRHAEGRRRRRVPVNDKWHPETTGPPPGPPEGLCPVLSQGDPVPSALSSTISSVCTPPSSSSSAEVPADPQINPHLSKCELSGQGGLFFLFLSLSLSHL